MGALDNIIRSFQAKQPQNPAAKGNSGNNNGNSFTPPQGDGNMQFQQPTQNNGQNNAQNNQGGATLPNMNGNDGSGNNNPNANGPKAEPNPMDRFGNPFDNKDKPDVAPSFTLDDATLNDVASKQKFFDGIDSELLSKADTGDVGAMRQVQELAMQNMYKTLLKHNGTLTDKFVSAREQHGEKSFGKKVKSQLTAASMASHPAMKNPVVRQQMNETAERFQKQNPDASPEDIKEMTVDYYKTIGELFGEPKKAGEGEQGQPKNADFSAWFDDQPASEGDESKTFF